MLIEVKNIDTSYGNLQALWDISMNVEKGEIISLIGSNGAGKTTFLKSLSGILKPSRGSIRYQGRELIGKHASDIVKMGITLCPEGRQVFARMSVNENLKAGAYTVDKATMARGYERAYELFPILRERSAQYAGTLSGGEQQMLAIARALMSNPDVLMLDEPSLGLSPLYTEKIFELILQIQSQGVTIIMVEQNANLALSISDRAYVIRNGRCILSGTGEELLQNQQVISTYLGG